MKKIFIIGLLTINTGLLISAMEIEKDEINKVESNQISLNNQLIIAAKTGDIDSVKELLAKGAEVNATDQNGGTPLHSAAYGGFSALVELLIEAGVGVDTKGKNGWVPLHLAAEKGFVEIVQLLIEAKAEVNAEITDDAFKGWTPLHFAAKNNSAEVAELLIEAKAKVNATDANGVTPLHLSAKKNFAGVAEKLITAGAELNTKITLGLFKGLTPLHLAVEKGSVEVAGQLIEAKAELNTKITYGLFKGLTPLHLAAKKNSAEVAQLLLSRFTLPEQEIATTTFINKKNNDDEEKEEIWDLTSLALMEVLRNIDCYVYEKYEKYNKKDWYKQDWYDFLSSLDKFKSILPFIDLRQDNIIKIIKSSEYTSKVLEDFCKYKHLEGIKKYIEIPNKQQQTAFDIALRNKKNNIANYLENILEAQDYDSLDEYLKEQIENNYRAVVGYEAEPMEIE